MEKKRVIVTGGGASGLMAAIAAAENGAAVTILEQNENRAKRSALQETANVILPISRCSLTHIEAKIQDLNRQF